MRILTISGYKSHEIGIYKQSDPAVSIIKKALKQQILANIEEGLEWILVSGQLGVEMWAAEVVIELKEQYPELKLAILTAFEQHEEKWNESNQEMYQQIVLNADFVDSISKKPYQNPQQLRNKNLFHLSKSDGLLIIYDDENEGSPKFLWEMAKEWSKKEDYSLTQINFQDLQWLVEESQMDDD
ncbi:DUF1273 domain-containing protein [Jeotgalibacillus campisalis]|uniref:UPF0398 protein KR50_21860 n=1 Tax=Jeotgalibacillus campisalis TaxID=220754 RepID=A0A0C2S1Z3_9BACL|nr:DUF1273 domain-containing protein [Jeotgalibacillus campisalis]KIL48019.1 hypothetical protein KR50_21860 [Jeotgalibacillus campisalis]